MNINTIRLVLTIYALSPMAQAVSPAPDGVYPGGNTAEGQNALLSLTTGTYNTAVGCFSLRSNAEGSRNTAIGAGALFANNADENTATGVGTLFNNTGFRNTAVGTFALLGNTTGNVNTAIGTDALIFNTIGTNNIALGFDSGVNVTTADDVICIGSTGANVSTSCFIGNIRNVQTANADAIPVLIDSTGQLGTASSSRRFKKETKPMDKASESILALKPVTFHYKSDKTATPQFGLIAEDVAEVNPDLVVRDEKGEIYTVRYDAVNAMLLNEFLKVHKTVEGEDRELANQESKIREQEATITDLKRMVAKQENALEALTAHVRGHDSQIQSVSAQVEIMSRPASKLAAKRN